MEKMIEFFSMVLPTPAVRYINDVKNAKSFPKHVGSEPSARQ